MKEGSEIDIVVESSVSVAIQKRGSTEFPGQAGGSVRFFEVNFGPSAVESHTRSLFLKGASVEGAIWADSKTVVL